MEDRPERGVLIARGLLSILGSNRLHVRALRQIASRARGYSADDYATRSSSVVGFGVSRGVVYGGIRRYKCARHSHNHAEALVELQLSNSIGRQLPVCGDAAARADLSSSRYDGLDCAEGEDGSGELSGTEIRPDHHGRGGPRGPRASVGKRLPGWSDRGRYRAEDHHAAGCQVSRALWGLPSASGPMPRITSCST